MPFNVGAVIRGPRLEQKLAERILSERQVFALLEAVEDRPREPAPTPNSDLVEAIGAHYYDAASLTGTR